MSDQASVQVLDPFRLRRREIRSFTDIVLEIQFDPTVLEVFGQLPTPITGKHGAEGRRRDCRNAESAEERLAFEQVLRSLERSHADVHPRAARAQRSIGDLEEGRIEVGAGDRCTSDGPRSIWFGQRAI